MSYAKMAERFLDFENNNFKTNLLVYEAKQLDENKHMALDDWISQVVV